MLGTLFGDMARPTPQSAPVTEPDPTHRSDDESPMHRTDDGNGRRRPGDAPVSEDLLVRNYDIERRYTLHVTAEDPESGTVFEWTYYLDPGEFRSEIGVLDPGRYEISVEAESCGRDSETCTVGPDPSGTALVETGNLTVSVSNDIY